MGIGRVLLVVGIIAFMVGGAYAQVALMAAMGGLGSIWSALLALPFTLLLPLVLALRAVSALKERGLGVVGRRLTAITLVVLTHLASIGVVMEWVGLKDGEMAATAFLAFDEFGGVPVLSGMLEKQAMEHGALDLKELARRRRERGRPVPVVADAGPAATPPDAGVATGEVNTQSGPTDAGANGVGVASIEGGQAKPSHTEPVTSTPAPAVGDATLSMWVERPAHKDRYAILQLVPGGGVRWIPVDTAALPKTPVRRARVHADGHVVVLLGAHEVWHGQVGAPLTQVPDLCVNPADTTERVVHVHDVVAGPGKTVIAVVDLVGGGAVDENNPTQRALVSVDDKGEFHVHRRVGAAVPDSTAGIARDFSLRAVNAGGGFVVVEEFQEDGKGVRPDLSGKQFVLNPQRVLSSHARSPGVLIEVARTGQRPQGWPQKTLQAFADARLLDDGRVLFDANFKEAGREGWVFVGDAAGLLQPVHGQLAAKKAGFGSAAPRVRHLDVSRDGLVAFVNRGGSVQTTSLTASGFSKPHKQLVVEDAKSTVGPDGKPQAKVVGSLSQVRELRLASDGWMVVHGTLRTPDGVDHAALVRANPALLKEGKATLVVLDARRPPPRRERLWEAK